MRSVSEPVQLVSQDGNFRRVFVPGEPVSDEWVVPDEFRGPDFGPADGAPDAPINTSLPTVQNPATDADGDDAPADDEPTVQNPDDGDDDGDDDGEDDSDPEFSGAGPEPFVCDMTASVAVIEAAVMAVPAGQREAAARWVIDHELVRPSPRSTLLAGMRGLMGQ